jgi:hypothetical protein
VSGQRSLLSELSLDKGRQWNQVKDDIDEEEGYRKDTRDSKVKPTIHENMKFIALVTKLFLKVMGSIYVPKKGSTYFITSVRKIKNFYLLNTCIQIQKYFLHI